MTSRLRSSVAARIHLEHGALARLLDTVAEAPSIHALRAALWELFLQFNKHLDYEERELAPVLAKGPDPQSATRMILEHNEQRRVLLELVDDAERDAFSEEDLLSRASRLVDTLRKDIAEEEAAFTPLTLHSRVEPQLGFVRPRADG